MVRPAPPRWVPWALVGAVVLSVAGVELAFRGVATPIDQLFEVLDREVPAADLVYVGNSHVGALGQRGWPARSRVVNLSVGGADLAHMRQIVERIASRGGHPLVVVGLEHDMIGYDLALRNQAWKDRQFFPHTGELLDDGVGNRILAHSAFFRANRDIRLLRARDAAPPTPADFVPASIDAPDACARRGREHGAVQFDPGLIGKNARELSRLLETLRAAGLDALALTPPKRACYLDALPGNVVARADSIFRKATREAGVPWLDLTRDPAFDDADFIDPDHLAGRGADAVVARIRDYSPAVTSARHDR